MGAVIEVGGSHHGVTSFSAHCQCTEFFPKVQFLGREMLLRNLVFRTYGNILEENLQSMGTHRPPKVGRGGIESDTCTVLLPALDRALSLLRESQVLEVYGKTQP